MEISQSNLDQILEAAYNDGFQKGIEVGSVNGYVEGYEKTLKKVLEISRQVIYNKNTNTNFPASIQKFTNNLEGF